MSKLRQKNPGTIRTPEEDLGRTNYTMDYTVVLPHSGLISPYIADLCAEAGESTYTRHADLVSWAAAQGKPQTFQKGSNVNHRSAKLFGKLLHKSAKIHHFGESFEEYIA